MAKTTSKPPKNSVEWKGYLRVNLTREQEAEFDVWFPTQTILLSDCGILCNNGYKFSLNWDKFHDGVSASLYANNEKLARCGWTLTAWAPSVEEAIGLLFYKHYVICEEDWERFYDVVEKHNPRRG
jgi:hypothetical protein